LFGRGEISEKGESILEVE